MVQQSVFKLYAEPREDQIVSCKRNEHCDEDGEKTEKRHPEEDDRHDQQDNEDPDREIVRFWPACYKQFI